METGKAQGPNLLSAQLTAVFCDRRRRVPQEEPWRKLSEEHVGELVHEVASLPSELTDDDEEAKRFDLLMLNLQLSVLHVQPGFERLKEQVRSIVGMLED